MVVVARPPAPRPGYNVAGMNNACAIHDPGLLADKPFPSLPHSTIKIAGVGVLF